LAIAARLRRGLPAGGSGSRRPPDRMGDKRRVHGGDRGPLLGTGGKDRRRSLMRRYPDWAGPATNFMHGPKPHLGHGAHGCVQGTRIDHPSERRYSGKKTRTPGTRPLTGHGYGCPPKTISRNYHVPDPRPPGGCWCSQHLPGGGAYLLDKALNLRCPSVGVQTDQHRPVEDLQRSPADVAAIVPALRSDRPARASAGGT